MTKKKPIKYHTISMETGQRPHFMLHAQHFAQKNVSSQLPESWARLPPFLYAGSSSSGWVFCSLHRLSPSSQHISRHSLTWVGRMTHVWQHQRRNSQGAVPRGSGHAKGHFREEKGSVTTTHTGVKPSNVCRKCHEFFCRFCEGKMKDELRWKFVPTCKHLEEKTTHI